MSKKRRHHNKNVAKETTMPKANETILGANPIAWCVMSAGKYEFYSINKSLLEAFIKRKGRRWDTIYRIHALGKEVTLDSFIDQKENSRIIKGLLNQRDQKN